jgi:hypothetical protein
MGFGECVCFPPLPLKPPGLLSIQPVCSLSLTKLYVSILDFPRTRVLGNEGKTPSYVYKCEERREPGA